MKRPETRYAKTVDGYHIAYQVFGDGPPDIVYTPGFVSNIDTAWDIGRHGPFFTELASLGRVIIFDRRGTGLSDRPDRIETLALEYGVNDIVAVMEAAGSDPRCSSGSRTAEPWPRCSPPKIPNGRSRS